jgi:hypothetical protein
MIHSARLLIMLIMPFARTTLLAVLPALVTSGSPARAEPLLAAAPNHPGSACTQSTQSVRQLATIESSAEARFQCIGVSLEGETVKGLRLETHSFSASPGHAESERIAVLEFPPAVVEGNHGAVLDGVPGHDAIILRGQLSMPPGKIRLATSYLYNGFTGEYRTCQITLDRTPDHVWRLVNHSQRTISRILIITRQIPVVGSFGIASLEGACS